MRSLFREVSEVAVFPTNAVFENSVTALIAGIYLVIVGVAGPPRSVIQNTKATRVFSNQGVLILLALKLDCRYGGGVVRPCPAADAALHQPLLSAATL